MLLRGSELEETGFWAGSLRPCALPTPPLSTPPPTPTPDCSTSGVGRAANGVGYRKCGVATSLAELMSGVGSVQGFCCHHLPGGELLGLVLFTCALPPAALGVTLAPGNPYPSEEGRALLFPTPQY